MNKKLIKLLSFCLLCMICFASCERYPVRALLGLPDPIDSWPDVWYLYDDEINTKGSLEPKRWDDDSSCADWSKVKLNFACKDHPRAGRNCIQLTWVGNSQEPDPSAISYFGFGLKSTEYDDKTINLTNSGYSSLKFWVRGVLYNNCSFKIMIPKTKNENWVELKLTNADINGIWKEYTVPLTKIEYMKEIEYDISIALIAEGGITNGGTIYLDDIRFTKD